MPTTRYKLAAASAPDLNGVEPEPGSEPEPEPPAMTQGQAAKRLVNLLENGLRPEQLTAVLEYAVIMGAPAPGTVRDALLSYATIENARTIRVKTKRKEFPHYITYFNAWDGYRFGICFDREIGRVGLVVETSDIRGGEIIDRFERAEYQNDEDARMRDLQNGIIPYVSTKTTSGRRYHYFSGGLPCVDGTLLHVLHTQAVPTDADKIKWLVQVATSMYRVYQNGEPNNERGITPLCPFTIFVSTSTSQQQSLYCTELAYVQASGWREPTDGARKMTITAAAWNFGQFATWLWNEDYRLESLPAPGHDLQAVRDIPDNWDELRHVLKFCKRPIHDARLRPVQILDHLQVLLSRI